MPKIGQEFVKVETMQKCLVVYVKQPTLAAEGNILVKHDDGPREWLTDKILDQDYVEK